MSKKYLDSFKLEFFKEIKDYKRVEEKIRDPRCTKFTLTDGKTKYAIVGAIPLKGTGVNMILAVHQNHDGNGILKDASDLLVKKYKTTVIVDLEKTSSEIQNYLNAGFVKNDTEIRKNQIRLIKEKGVQSEKES